MNLFINDKSIKIASLNGGIQSETFNSVLSGKDEIISKRLIGNVLIEDASTGHVERLLKLLEVKKLRKLDTITLTVKDKDVVAEFIKDQFKIVKAAGGVVIKDNKVLLIFRLGKWDLPKGKLKKKEDPVRGGIREVEEECNIKVTSKQKLCATWHTYIRKGKRVLKKTNWYVMDCVNDLNMRPQLEEDIEEVKWIEKQDIKACLKNSYRSIEKVFEIYYKGTDF